MPQILKDPFVQFLLIGAAIFAASVLVQRQDPESVTVTPAAEVLRVDAPTLQWLHANFTTRMGRQPTHTEMEHMVEYHLDEEVKVREAISLGLDQDDSIVRRRLAQKFDFLMGHSAANDTPAEGELEAWIQNRPPTPDEEPRITFEHLWFNPDERGTDAFRDAEAARLRLNEGADVEADLFPLGDRYEFLTPTQIRKDFGPQFAEAVLMLGLHEWSAPVRSGYGIHLVRVEERQQPPRPAFDNGTDLEAWRRERSAQQLEATVNELRSKYEIEIDRDALEELPLLDEGIS